MTKLMECNADMKGDRHEESGNQRFPAGEDEAEDIRSYLYSYDELMDLVDRQELDNAPLIMMALWLSRHRERLRAGA